MLRSSSDIFPSTLHPLWGGSWLLFGCCSLCASYSLYLSLDPSFPCLLQALPAPACAPHLTVQCRRMDWGRSTSFMGEAGPFLQQSNEGTLDAFKMAQISIGLSRDLLAVEIVHGCVYGGAKQTCHWICSRTAKTSTECM